MKSIKVLLIDYDKKLINSIKKYFSNHNKIEICFSCSDGISALNTIEKNLNDYQIVILDLLLSGVDGIKLIKRINEIDKSKMVIVNTSYISERILNRLEMTEVDSILLKPVELSYLEEKLLEISNCKDNKCIEKEVVEILHNLGVPTHLKGYEYLKKSIISSYENNIKNLYTDLYPLVAADFSTSEICVEKNIRTAIETSWNRGNYNTIEEVFGYSVCSLKGKPTNLQYIMTIVEKLKLRNLK